MTYNAQSKLSQDSDFRNRVAACAATQPEVTGQPTMWADTHLWDIAAAPGFADKYQYALDTDVEHPGADEAVIPDADILAAVQAMIAELQPPPNPAPE